MIQMSFIGTFVSSGFIERDVKAGNILVDAEGNIRLADLGVARVVSREKATTFVGTPCWMAPELMEKKPYDSRVHFPAILHTRLIFGP